MFKTALGNLLQPLQGSSWQPLAVLSLRALQLHSLSIFLSEVEVLTQRREEWWEQRPSGGSPLGTLIIIPDAWPVYGLGLASYPRLMVGGQRTMLELESLGLAALFHR